MNYPGGYERYLRILHIKGLKHADVARATGIHPSTFSDWKKGKSSPKIDKLQKIADFFGVPITYFTSAESDENNQYYFDDETAEIAQEIFDNKELRALFKAARNSDADDLKMAHDMLLALKRKERGE